MDRPNNNGFPDNIVMGEVDYSNLPYIISLFVLILSLCEWKVLLLVRLCPKSIFFYLIFSNSVFVEKNKDCSHRYITARAI